MSFLAYGGMSLAAYWPIFPGDPSRVPTQASGDIVQDIWFLDWTPYAIVHGLNPFYTHLINAPYGVNTAQNTQMPLLGVLSAPLTWLVSPVASYNLLLWLSFTLSSLSMAYVVRRWTTWFPAAFAAGLLYGFGP
ncbi:MAG TPA: hypothetical protein VMD59_16505, partial [Acidimicrobiales bacterium]|nr:hypothetical protein [Acidimicrobiales bacterium]